MEVTQISIEDTTDEEFIEAFRECSMKFKGDTMSFKDSLELCLKLNFMGEDRALKLHKLWVSTK
jgi:hypothetical protein